MNVSAMTGFNRSPMAWFNDPSVSLKKKSWAVGISSLVLLWLLFWILNAIFGSSSPAPVNGSISQDFVTRYNDENKLITNNIERLTKDLSEARTNLEKLKVKADKTAQDILQMQQNQNIDPKSLELQQQNRDRLQKLLDTPMPPMTPVS